MIQSTLLPCAICRLKLQRFKLSRSQTSRYDDSHRGKTRYLSISGPRTSYACIPRDVLARLRSRWGSDDRTTERRIVTFIQNHAFVQQQVRDDKGFHALKQASSPYAQLVCVRTQKLIDKADKCTRSCVKKVGLVPSSASVNSGRVVHICRSLLNK
jgi:hypothetical protein